MRRTNYGLTYECLEFPEINKTVCLLSRDMLRDCFQRNKELLRLIDSSMTKQRGEMNVIYNLRLSANTFSQLANGHRYKCGLLLLVTLKHYWLVKGYEFRIDCI